jgi:MGT family glycosyltransferase
MIPADAVVSPVCQFVYAPPFNWSEHYPLPAWFATLPDRPIVHATLGTTFSAFTQELYATILAGLRDEPYSLIVTVGNSIDPAAFGVQPENVYIERFISHAALLPKCTALLTHGGLGTLLAALDCGLPFLTVPITADQPENAAMCEATGVSLTIPATELTPEGVKTAIRRILDEPSFRVRAQQIQAEMRAFPDMQTAVALLERLAHEQQPIMK